MATTHIFYMYGGELGPIASGLVVFRSDAPNWHKQVLPVLDNLYRELTGKPVRVKNAIQYHVEGVEEPEQFWRNCRNTKRHLMYEIDSKGISKIVNDPR